MYSECSCLVVIFFTTLNMYGEKLWSFLCCLEATKGITDILNLVKMWSYVKRGESKNLEVLNVECPCTQLCDHKVAVFCCLNPVTLCSSCHLTYICKQTGRRWNFKRDWPYKICLLINLPSGRNAFARHFGDILRACSFLSMKMRTARGGEMLSSKKADGARIYARCQTTPQNTSTDRGWKAELC